MNKVFIGVVYHKISELFQNECLYPIHAGKLYSDFDLNIDGDDTGDHISDKNSAYAELTALYWIWKNVKADIKGLFHYRRFLDLYGDKFSEILYEEELNTNFNSAAFINKKGLTQEHLLNLFSECDIISGRLQDFSTFNSLNVATQYTVNHIPEYFELAMQAIKELYPEYLSSFIKIYSNTKSYIMNVFIMKSSEFDGLCSFVFEVLKNIENKINPYDKRLAPNTYNARWAGFLGERLIGAYIYKRKMDGVLSKEYPIVILNEENSNWLSTNTYDFKNTNNPNLAKLDELNNSEKPVVSVILCTNNRINIGKYLNILQKQPLHNYELIVNTKEEELIELINKYNDNKIRCINCNNVHDIISNCNGKYIHFANENDYIQNNFYKNIIVKAEKEDSQIVISTCKMVNDKNCRDNENSILPMTVFNTTTNIHNNPDILMSNFNISTKIFLKDFLISNKDIIENNKICFWLKLLNKCENVSILRDNQYEHFYNKDFNIDIKTSLEILKSFEKFDEFSSEHNNELNETYDAIKMHVIYDLISLNLSEICNVSEQSNKFLEKISEILDKTNNKLDYKLAFYTYNKAMMDELRATDSISKMRDIVLNYTGKLIIDYNDINKYWYNMQHLNII